MAAPLQNNLRPMANRIRYEDCRYVRLGDSLSAKIATYRMGGGIARVWPVTWKGRVTQGHAGVADDGTYIASVGGAGMTTNHRLPEAVWAGGQSKISPCSALELVATANLADVTGLLNPNWIEIAGYYYGGVATWMQPALTMRLIWYAEAETMPSLRVYARRSGAILNANHGVAATGAGAMTYNEVSLPSGSGRPDINVTTFGTGAVIGKRFGHIASLIYDPAVAKGFQLDVIAEGGWNTRHLLDPTVDAANGKFTDAALQEYLTATRLPNLFHLHIGANSATGESSGGETTSVYKTNVELVIDRFRAAAIAVGVPDPLFILTCGYPTDAGNRYNSMAELLYDISREQADVGFINLNQRVVDKHGAYASWQATYTTDGSHPNLAGTNEFATLEWEAILAADAHIGGRPSLNRLRLGL